MIAPLAGVPTDYAGPENWLARPAAPDKLADVFYVYPTSYITASPDEPMICAVDDRRMRARARSNLHLMEGIFSGAVNVFSPYYRQGSVNQMQHIEIEEAIERVMGKEPRTDLYTALDYYFEHLNAGRPFFLAGHSQGSMLVRTILREYMAAHPDRYARMIAAYVVGFSITRYDLAAYPHLRFAEGAEDTGVVVSWNTEGPGNGESSLVRPGAISINPLNWKRDGTYAPVSENMGSLLMEPDGQKRLAIPGVADARVDTERGVVVCTNTDYPYFDASTFADTPVFGEKSFHGFDYLFYYENIRQNIAVRTAAFLKSGRNDANG